MSVRSMTGFAQVRKTVAEGEISLTLKSVNHRGLDLHIHLPPELDGLEHEVRAAMKGAVLRGHIQVQVGFARTSGAGAPLWNRELMENYIRAFREAAEIYHLEGQPDLNAALRIPGMLGTAGAAAEPGESVKQAVAEGIREAVQALNASREVEGFAMAREMRQRCDTLRDLVSRMETIRAGAVPAFQARLEERLAELLRGSALDAQRLAQEAAILADRSDVTEELVRLRTHSCQLEGLLAAEGEVGKRLDFLLQEMNREANTVLSKTGGLGDLGLTITELALAAKAEIDKIREQSLNLE